MLTTTAAYFTLRFEREGKENAYISEADNL